MSYPEQTVEIWSKSPRFPAKINILQSQNPIINVYKFSKFSMRLNFVINIIGTCEACRLYSFTRSEYKKYVCYIDLSRIQYACERFTSRRVRVPDRLLPSSSTYSCTKFSIYEVMFASYPGTCTRVRTVRVVTPGRSIRLPSVTSIDHTMLHQPARRFIKPVAG